MCTGVVQIPYHTIPPLSTQQWWVPGGTKTGKIVNGISCRKCADFSPKEMRLYKREFQCEGCKLLSLLNSRGFQTINLYICIYIYIWTLEPNKWRRHSTVQLPISYKSSNVHKLSQNPCSMVSQSHLINRLRIIILLFMEGHICAGWHARSCEAEGGVISVTFVYLEIHTVYLRTLT